MPSLNFSCGPHKITMRITILMYRSRKYLQFAMIELENALGRYLLYFWLSRIHDSPFLNCSLMWAFLIEQ